MAGQGNGSATLYTEDDLIASTTALKIKTKMIDSGARDDGHPVASTNLRRGLCLGKVTASGRYKQFDFYAVDGTEVEEDLCVLNQEVYDIDDNHKEVACILAGMLHKAGMHLAYETVTYSVDYDGQSANNAVGDTLTFSGGGTATLLAQTDAGATGTITFRMLTGAVPANDETFSNGASGDGTVDGTPALVGAEALATWNDVQRIERVI